MESGPTGDRFYTEGRVCVCVCGGGGPVSVPSLEIASLRGKTLSLVEKTDELMFWAGTLTSQEEVSLTVLTLNAGLGFSDEELGVRS